MDWWIVEGAISVFASSLLPSTLRAIGERVKVSDWLEARCA